MELKVRASLSVMQTDHEFGSGPAYRLDMTLQEDLLQTRIERTFLLEPSGT